MENFLNVKHYWNDIKMFKLQTNYRSKAHIVAAWNSVIKNNKKALDETIEYMELQGKSDEYIESYKNSI